MPLLGVWTLIPILAEDVFGFLRLASWAVFVHLPLLLLVVIGLRQRRDRSAVLGLVTATVLVAVGFWAFFVEPKRLEVNQVEIVSAKLEREIEIAVLADFQTDRIGAYEQRVLDTLAEVNPDLILLTGDYLQVESLMRPLLREAFQAAWLKAGIDPPLGTFAVQGNTDPATWPKLFRELDVFLLSDETAEASELGTAGLELHGLSLGESFNPSRRSVTSSSTTAVDDNEGPFIITFGHGPDFALGLEDADLLVAGHTHGGQVRLPFFGPPITFSQVPRSWAAGATELPQGGTLLVSRGTGLERGYAPRLRFLCPPELVVIRLRPGRAVPGEV